jgi:exosortase/archaeosortase family protein
MDQQPAAKTQLIQAALGFGLILALTHLIDTTGLVSDMSRSLIVGVVQLGGGTAADLGEAIIINQITLPWTQDCSGINALLLLWTITLWTQRQQRFSVFTGLRLLACIPLALLVNLARVLSVAAYRSTFYPDWESPQMHYFAGYLFLLPCVPLLVPVARQRARGYCLELLYLVTVLSLVTPLILMPGGTLLALCSLVYLAQSQFQDWRHVGVPWLLSLWLLVGLAIALAASESLWIPWLLLAPMLVNRALLTRPEGWLVLSGTISALAMNNAWQLAVIAALAVMAWRYRPGTQPETGIAQSPAAQVVTTMAGWQTSLMALLILTPFILPILMQRDHELQPPPRGVMARQMAFNSYEVKLTGQPVDLTSFWYGPFCDGRHHALVSCMTFRGIQLEPVDDFPGVYSGEDQWLAEFFIYNGQLLDNYPSYLLASFVPLKGPGVHVIFAAPADTISAAYFKEEASRVATRLAGLQG